MVKCILYASNWVLLCITASIFFACDEGGLDDSNVVPLILRVSGKPAWSSQDIVAVGHGPTIFYCNGDGKNSGYINPEPRMEVENISWAPDGSTLVYEGWISSNPELYKMTFPAGEVSLFVNANATDPAWAPDGRSIAFVREKPSGYSDICVIPANGGDEEIVVKGGFLESPAWIPDSNRISYVAYNDGEKRYEVWTLNLTTRERRLLLSGFDPAWSPNGQWLAYTYVCDLGEDQHIYLYNAWFDYKVLFVGPMENIEHAWARYPAWSPKGDWLAFHGTRELYGTYKKPVNK